MATKMEQLVEKEVRGVNVKNLLALIAATATICSTVIGGYNMLANKINDVKNDVNTKFDKAAAEKVQSDRYDDLRMRVMEQNITALQLQLEKLRNE